MSPVAFESISLVTTEGVAPSVAVESISLLTEEDTTVVANARVVIESISLITFLPSQPAETGGTGCVRWYDPDTSLTYSARVYQFWPDDVTKEIPTGWVPRETPAPGTYGSGPYGAGPYGAAP